MLLPGYRFLVLLVGEEEEGGGAGEKVGRDRGDEADEGGREKSRATDERSPAEKVPFNGG